MFDFRRCTLGSCPAFAAIVSVFALTACHSGAMTPPSPAESFQSRTAPESLRAQSRWELSEISSGFSGPLAVDAARNIYVPLGSDDTYQNDVNKIAPNGKVTHVGHGFFVPDGVAVHDSYVFIADYGHNAIKRIAPNGATSVVASVERPGAIAVGKGGSIYVVTSSCGCIEKIKPDGKTTDVFNLKGNVDNIALDNTANLYVASYSFGRYGCCATGKVYKITPRGNVSAHLFKRKAPESVAVDGNGNIYVGAVQSEFSDPAVYKIAPNGKETKIAKLGDSDSYLQGLAFRSGALYVADAGVASVYSAIYKISP